MKKEFITANGKVIIENGILRVRTLISRPSTTWPWMAFILYYALTKLSDDTRAKPLFIVTLVFIGIGLLILLSEILFINTWKNKISLNDIKSYKTQQDNYGLETEVIIYLKSGRQKKITFRNHEHQLEPFLEVVTQYITQLQTVH